MEAGDNEWRSWGVQLVAVGLAILWIVVLRFTLNPWWAQVLLDYHSAPPEEGRPVAGLFPFSLQNMMWIAFAVGLAQLWMRWRRARVETMQLRQQYLPEDPRVVLQAQDLPDVYRRLQLSPYRRSCFLPRLIDRCILQFQASQSTSQSASLLNTSVEMFLHEVDLRYNLIRYLCWLIPSLGFIGTVIGIGRALEFAGSPEGQKAGDQLLTTVTGLLSVSFNGTFLALVLASVLVLLQNRIQEMEEHALNLGAQYCLDNLINRLYVAKS
jgi:biopolymer transport protein ExbB/TolQ